jgi:putative heme iron utilization protein
MSTESITPLRQRMIEDMNARKLSAGTQRATSAAVSGSLRF